MFQLGTIRHLILSGGLDSMDQQDEVSTQDHEIPLQELAIFHQRYGREHLGPQQLCWLVSLNPLTQKCIVLWHLLIYLPPQLHPTIGHLRSLTLVLAACRVCSFTHKSKWI